MGLFCLDRRTLAGSVDLDRALRDNASDLGPSCSLLVWDIRYIASSNIFYSIIGPWQTWMTAWCARRDIGLLSLDR